MAAGDTIDFWPAQAGFPPATDHARDGRTATTKAPILLFDDTTTETYFYQGYMPGQYDGTTAFDIEIHWKFLTFVGSQTCKWDVSFARIQDDVDSVDSIVFATAQTATPTEASATGEPDYATISFTNAQADGIQPNELYYLRVQRDASGGTASPGDAQLISIALNEG